MFKYISTALKGPSQARAAHQQALKQCPNIQSGIKQLQEQCPANINNDSEEPIFLFSAGWRSGSTLLQRLIISDSKVLMWGEPYDECGIIQTMADTTTAFRANWPPSDYYYNGSSTTELSGMWVANLFPSLDDLRKSHRAFFDTLFSEPAKKAGANQWGIKEVRLGVEHCAYLQWIYPKARFIFLYRNPLDAYGSYCRYGRSWYNTFPDKPVFTATTFGSHWKTLMKGFLREEKKINALLVKYEDLVTGRMALEEIETHLNITIDRSVIKSKVGSSERDGEKVQVNSLEKWLLKRAVSPVAENLGYKW
ncbi:MAG: hypothetical protein GQ532_00085 [Methylomarinum sp.]|nr:hypothetical protein [Methylomarinum sp.]